MRLLILILFVCFIVGAPDVGYAQQSKKKKELTEEEIKEKEEADAELEERRLELALKNLGSTNYNLIEISVYKLEQMGEEAIPHLTKIIRDRDNDKRQVVNAIYTLGRIGRDAKRAVPLMVPYLKEKDEDFIAVTAIALGKIGPSAQEAIPILAKLQYHKNKWVAESAHEALKQMRITRAQEAINTYYESDLYKKRKAVEEERKRKEEGRDKLRTG